MVAEGFKSILGRGVFDQIQKNYAETLSNF